MRLSVLTKKISAKSDIVDCVSHIYDASRIDRAAFILERHLKLHYMTSSSTYSFMETTSNLFLSGQGAWNHQMSWSQHACQAMAASEITEQKVLADRHQLMIVRLGDRKAEVPSNDPMLSIGKHCDDIADVCS